MCPPEGWVGQYCEEPVDLLCKPQPCLNGGTCDSAFNPGEVYCYCPPDWQGQFCEEPFDVICAAEPCLHGGTCNSVLYEGEVYCFCPPEWEGQYCEEPIVSDPLCDPQPCLNLFAAAHVGTYVMAV